MADFIDDEAVETSSDEESESRIRKNKKQKVIDSSEEEEEDEEEEEPMDDLINDEEESTDDEAAGSKRSRDDDDDDVSSSVDEEDYDLIREAGVSIQKRKKKQFKRIKKVADSDEEAEPDDGRTAIERDLFPDRELLESDDDEAVRSRPKPRDIDLNVDSEEDESDSDDNFIVDDDDQPIKKDKRKKVHTDSALAEAIETFGVDFDYNDVDEDYDDAYEDGYGDDEYLEDEETGEPRPRRKKGGRKTIYDIYEPAELERSHMTTFDHQVRTKDEPERFQLRSIPVTEADDDELEQEAAWIHKTAFGQPTISIQEKGNDPIAGRRSEFIKGDIKYALSCIRNEKLEVPFIAAYRREYVLSISSNFDDTRDLWTIYKYDEQWCRFKASKDSLLSLFKNMQIYLKTKPEGSKFREITDYDFKCVECASNFHEIDDCRIHFKLYYSSFVPEMKLYFIKKKIDDKKAANTGQSRETDKEPNENEDDIAQSQNGDQTDDPELTELEKLHERLSKVKISSSKDLYHRCYQEGLDDLVSKFGLSGAQFGENLHEDYQRNNVTQCQRRPLDAAQDVMSAQTTRFTNREACLKAATYMFAKELSSDPIVRKMIRRNFFDNSVINVKPTTLGMKEIDENHPCYSIKFLRNKPVTRLEGEQILNLVNAERDKLLEVEFSIEPIDSSHPHLSPYHESLKALYYSDFSSIVTKEWNDQREEAIKICTSKFLMPSFEKQLRERLIGEAQDKIIKDCCEKLHNWLNVAPYAPAAGFDDHEDFELRNGTRICGFTFAPDGDVPCFAAIVDSEGELIDHVRLPYLNMRKRPDRMNATERENHAKDRQKFKQFMINRKPHAVALAAETIQTKYICQDLAQILDELREHDGLPLIPIEIVDNELSNVYMNLKRANEEFPEFPPLLLQAISNARKLNDPLSEYAKLCTADDDILCIRFHSLQDDLPREEFLNALYQRFVTRTNAVGVDPNRAIAHPHTADIVQFIAGLGPRKGANLIRCIKKSSTGGQLVSRQQLVTELGMTSVVFINCAGFIKLDTDTLSDEFPDESRHITPLDSTRIHPQSYGLAKKIASDALDYEEDASDETTANAIEEILENPEKLDDLDLNAFARELDQVQNQGKKGYTLQSIREEFQVRYRDHREAYKAPSQEEIFAMLTKETPRTFYIGKLITCQVVQIPRKKPTPAQLDMANPVKIDETNLWRCPFCMRSDFQDLSVVWNHFDTGDCPGYAIGVRCKVDNGLFGFVPTKFISDREITDPTERVAIGQTIHARIIKIDTDKFSCDLTCRTSDLIDDAGKLKPAKDEFYDENAEKMMKRELELKSKRSTRRPYCKRVIVHPAFENIDFKACEKKLQLMEQGHAIIRPSSAGENFLTVSWKVCDGVNQHINIREEGKANAFSLGHQLYIDNESYEDLDEIIARYIQPMASYARELLNYKYCIQLKDGVEEEQLMQDVLLLEKVNNSNSFPYRFCPSRRLPGKFLLGYLPKNKPKIEYLTVTPRGYRFRRQYSKNLAILIKWFKENWNRMPPQVYPGVTPGMGESLRQTFPMSQ